MSDLGSIFAQLQAIMKPYAVQLDTKTDTATELYVDTRHTLANKKPLFFGAVQVKKSYVSYHLMPVYVKPELLDSISPELKKRMQGKSCFNFTAADPALLEELSRLTQAGFATYQELGYV